MEERFDPDRTLLTLHLSPTGDKSAINIGDNAGGYSNGKASARGEDMRNRIIAYLTVNPICKSSDIARLLDLSPSRTRDYLSMLVAEGVLVAEGANRNRVYRLGRSFPAPESE